METIRIQFDFKEAQNKHKYLFDDEKFYSSPEYFIAYQNYRKSKGNPVEELLTDLATSPIKSGFDAINYALFDKPLRKAIDKAVKEAAIKSGATWTD